MEDKTKLELMKSLADMPERPGLLPIPCIFDNDPFVEVPHQVTKYVQELGGTIDLEKDGRMRIDHYIKLLKEYSLDHLMIAPITIYSTITNEEAKSIKKSIGRTDY
ncbi:hypothetical protein [Flagellimonas sp. SN16]|uniref:hypothetical protein n=1 Tax=Flagellimonas sp. SN16 TaxID=3415142 RepID=UPI003C586508